MEIPNLKTEEEADTFLMQIYEEIIKKIEQTSSYKEKEKILKEFDILELSSENTIVGVEKIKDNEDYKETKKIIYEFFAWIEKERKVNVFKIIYKDSFYIKNQNFKFLLIASLLGLIPQSRLEVKIYLILNTFRTMYELNLKNLIVILNNLLEELGRPINKNSGLKEFYDEFSDYPNIENIKKYFVNDIRNPIAHEDWFLENNLIRMKENEVEKSFSIKEIFSQMYDLFFFRIAIKSYVMEGCKKLIKTKGLTPQQINSLIDIFKKELKDIKSKKYSK